MHDAKGRPLQVGDRVMIPATITQTYEAFDYCNIVVETIATMPPNTSKTVSTLNTKQLLRANDGDDITYEVVVDGEQTKIV